MTLQNATSKLKKAGFDVIGSKGSFSAAKGKVIISWFVNPESTNCSKFTFEIIGGSCSATYGLSLKQAMA